MKLPGDAASHITHVEDRAFNDRRYAVDSKKLEALGWSPKVSFEEGLAKTSKFFELLLRLWKPFNPFCVVDWYRTFGNTWWGDINQVLVAHPLKSRPLGSFPANSTKNGTDGVTFSAAL